MTPSQIAAAFDQLSKGAPLASVQPELTVLSAMLPDGDKLGLMQLALALTKLESPAALDAFDSAMDVLTSTAYAPEPGTSGDVWTTLLVSSLFQRPAGAGLVHFENAGDAEAQIAEALGLQPEEVRVFPVLWATDRVFYYDPSDVFCLSHSCCHQLVDGFSTPQDLESLDRATRLNSLEGSREPSEEDEALIYVCLRASPVRKAELVNRLRDAQLSFTASHSLAGQEALRVEHRLLDAGSPWSMTRTTLHVSQAISLARLVSDVAERSQLRLEDLCVHFSQVEAQADGAISVRAAVHTPQGALLAGVIQGDLAEPEQYIALATEALTAASVGVHHTPVVHTETDVGACGALGVLLPGKGWQRADLTFVPAAQL